MDTKQFILIYIIALVIFLALDFLWLGFIAKDFYRNNLKGIISEGFVALPAIIFYMAYVFGIVFLVVKPNIGEGVSSALISSALVFGSVAYATYDLTNAATIKEWPFNVVVIDVIWGAILTTSVSVGSVWIYGKIS